MRTETITSAQNPKIKALLELQEKSKARRKEGLFVVEGRRELLHCMEAGYLPYSIFFCPEIIGSDEFTSICKVADTHDARCSFFEIPQHLYDKVAYRGGTEGIIAQMHCRNRSLESLDLKKNPLVVILESVEKPGNLGAVLRSADASGVDAVIVCDPLTDLYNPNLIRSSIGAIFTVPVATASSEEIGDGRFPMTPRPVPSPSSSRIATSLSPSFAAIAPLTPAITLSAFVCAA